MRMVIKDIFKWNEILGSLIEIKGWSRAGSLNHDATADSTAAKKTWIFKSFSRITYGITRASP